jgi:hypothetical protein
MRVRYTLVLFALLILMCADTTVAQRISKELCDNINVSMVQIHSPMKVYRQDVYSDSCDFEFVTPENEHVSISIQQYKTNKRAHNDLKNDLGLFLAYNKMADVPRFARIQLNTDKHWDEIFFYKSNYRDNFMLLRKRNFNIVMISTNQSILINLETECRKLRL